MIRREEEASGTLATFRSRSVWCLLWSGFQEDLLDIAPPLTLEDMFHNDPGVVLT